MGPKVVKKKTKASKEAKQDEKKVEEEKQVEPKNEVPKVTGQVKVSPPQVSKNQEPKKQSGHEVIPTERPALTEAELIRLRRQKFKKSGSLMDASVLDEDSKVREERLKKFGGQAPETKEQIELRKKKFSNNALEGEDEEVIRKRREKFANKDSAIAAQDPNVLEERKRKFARNEEANISLDDQILKSKHKIKRISKDKHKHSIKKSKNNRQNRLNEAQRVSKRERIFGKGKFIKRRPLDRDNGFKRKSFRPRA